MGAPMQKLQPVKQPGTLAEDRMDWMVNDSHWQLKGVLSERRNRGPGVEPCRCRF